MSESSFLEVAASIREVLQQNLSLAQQYIPPQSNNPPPIEQPPIQRRFVDFSQHVSTYKLPPVVASEVTMLMAKQSHKYQEVAEQAHLRLLHDIYSSCDSVTAASLVPHARMARDSIYDRSVNRILEVANQLVGDLDPEGGSVSDADGSDSDSSSGDEDDDEDEEGEAIEDEPEEDENLPMKPGEEVPPLETKYLPIFEALHERGKVLTKPEKTYLVDLTGMTYRQITIWFQNRRRGELKEDMHARANSYAASMHSDQSSDLSDDELILEKKLADVQPSDTTFNIRSWRLAAAFAPSDTSNPTFPPSPTKVGFTDVIAPRLDSDTDSDLSDSDDDSNNGACPRVPSLTTSSATFDSSSDRGPATAASASSSQVLTGTYTEPAVVTEKNGSSEHHPSFNRPIKQLPLSRRASPPAQQRAEPQQAPAFSFNFAAPTSNAQHQFAPAMLPAPAQPPQFVTSNERGLTVEMDTTPPRSTITLRSSPTSAPVPANPSSGPAPITSPSSPVLPAGSPNSAPSPSPSGNSASSPRPAVKPLPRRTGCAPRPRPPPRAGSIATPTPGPATAANSARPSVVLSPVVLPPSSNPSLASTTLGALLRPNIPPPSIPAEIEDRLSAMAGRMGVGAAAGAQKRNSSTIAPMPPRGTSFNFGPSSLPGAGSSPGSHA